MTFLRRLGGTILVVAILWVLWVEWWQPELAARWDVFRGSGDSASPSAPTGNETAPVDIETGTVSTTMHKAPDLITVAKEDRQPYERSYFGKGWIDADDNCRDTRQEVLARESKVPVKKSCRIYEGKWYSYYDDTTWTQSHQVQIDHLVPLAEAWDSGAYQWDQATRIAYANDLGDPRTLVPTSTDLNQDKAADDPQWYIPKVNECRYISSWMAVKLRWNMTADEREMKAIRTVADGCPDTEIKAQRAKITLLPFAAGTGTTSKAVTFDSITYAGQAEVVVLKNTSKEPVTLIGWVVTDEIAYGQFRMPDTTLPPGATISIRSSKGSSRTDDAGNITYYANWGDVWNNSGDTAILIDGTRRVTDRCTYRGDDSGKVTC